MKPHKISFVSSVWLFLVIEVGPSLASEASCEDAEVAFNSQNYSIATELYSNCLEFLGSHGAESNHTSENKELAKQARLLDDVPQSVRQSLRPHQTFYVKKNLVGEIGKVLRQKISMELHP